MAVIEANWPCVENGYPRLRYNGVQPSPKQSAFLMWSGREALFGGAGGGGKAESLDTLIPTPTGFQRLGDIHPGDLVLGRDGRAHAVLAESEVVTVEGWRLTFDDGSTVECNDEHLWLTFDAKERTALSRRTPEFRERRRSGRPSRSDIGAGTRLAHTPEHRAALSARLTEWNRANPPATKPPPEGSVRTTAEIVATLRTRRGEANHAVPVCSAVDLPEHDLPVDPYVLGVWLGDGCKRSASIVSMDPPIIEQVTAAGYEIRRTAPAGRATNYFFNGLRADLKAMGLIGDKRVPHDYLWASVDQRVALLAGLIDTDGHVTTRGKVEFDNTNRALADAVAHLARSLGMKATVNESRATLYGRDCGPRYRVKFTPNRLDLSRLPRKRERLRTSTSSLSRFRRIVDAQRISPRPMKCLRVSAPDHLFLCTEHFIPTHNSIALLMAALQFVDVPGYNAAIFRNQLTDLELQDGLIDVAHDWLDDTPAKWNGNKRRWTFPNPSTGDYTHGATLQFLYMNRQGMERRYKSSQLHFIGFDEMTEFPWEEQVTYLYSRQRRPRTRAQALAQYGAAPDGLTLAEVPLRLRGATNPGGPGHAWCFERYIDPTNPNRKPFLSAKLVDNPGIDQQEYRVSLSELTEVERRRMEEGDWSVMEIPGALWRFADLRHIDRTVPYKPETVDVRVIGVDPSVSAEGDECGIILGSLVGGRVVVEDDLSGQMHPDDWARTIIFACENHKVDRVVVEDNQGGELLWSQLANVADALGKPRPRVVRVRATESKEGRAAKVATAYRKEGKVAHLLSLRNGRLEAQQTSWIPGQGKSPDRVDALVWLVRHLLWGEGDAVVYRSDAREKLARSDTAQRIVAPRSTAASALRRTPTRGTGGRRGLDRRA